MLHTLLNPCENARFFLVRLANVLFQHGAVGPLVSLLKSPSLEMVEQAMWVLGKMAQDSQDGTTARDTVLQAGALG